MLSAVRHELVLCASCASCAAMAACSGPASEGRPDGAADAVGRPTDARVDREDSRSEGGRRDAGGADAAPRSLGRVTGVAYGPSCDAALGLPVGTTVGGGQPNPNFQCATLTVSCDGVADLEAVVALSAQPPGTPPKGVIVTHDGVGGTTFFAGPPPAAWYADGFNVAEVAWLTPWQCPRGSPADASATCTVDTTPLSSRPGLVDAACRAATVFAWVHDAAKVPGGGAFEPKGAAFCGFGFSGGSGALWYSLLHYGLAEDFDYVGTSASTPYARIDVGCDPAYSSATIATPCTNLAKDPQVPEQFDSNHSTHASLIDAWSSTTSCDKNPSAEELAYWKRTSIVSTGASYDIPTPVTTYDCINPADVDVIPAMNAYLFRELRPYDPKDSRFGPECTLDGTNGTCSGEDPFGDAGGLEGQAIADMEKKCAPLRR